MLKTVCCAAAIAVSIASDCQAQTPAERGGQQGVPISPQLTQRLSDMLAREWNGNPEWATMASEILAGREPMGMGKGWFKPAANRYDWSWLRKTFDRKPRDGQIQQQELPQGTTDRQFRILDKDLDGVVSSRDLVWEKNPVMDTYSPANDVFDTLDRDANGRISKEELNKFFDRYADGFDYLTPGDLRRGLRFRPPPSTPDELRQPGLIPVARRWQLLDFMLTGGLGGLTEGPALNADAPDFQLPLLTKDPENHELKLSRKRVQLSDSKGKRPVVLIFGSFT